MSMAERRQLTRNGPAFNSFPEQCPFCPGTIAAIHTDVLAASIAEATFASPVSLPLDVAQTESKRRISRDRSHQKRGPPPTYLL